MSDKFYLVLCTCPSVDTASDIASILVESGFAACCNIIPGIQSIYKWQGEIEMSDEALLFAKTSAQQYPQLESVILSHHPYELPEIISVTIDNGLPGYLDWISNNLG